MQHSVIVAEGDTPQELLHERLDGDGIQLSVLSSRIHILLQVLVHVLEYQHEFVFRVDDVVQGDYVLMPQLFHQGDFSDGCRRCSFLRIEMYFFECHQLAILPVSAFEDLACQSGEGEGEGCCIGSTVA